VRKDRYGRVIEDISSTDSQAAHNLALSIDERLQALVYRELNNAVAFNKAESGSAVLVDVSTGEVLAMANSPSYNPNNSPVRGIRCVTGRLPTCLNRVPR
jgi:cell division protein FtsI (penicillin-binding protein 3)